MTKPEAREIIFNVARSYMRQGMAAEQFMYDVDYSPWVLSDKFLEAHGLVPEVLEHVVAFVWTWPKEL